MREYETNLKRRSLTSQDAAIRAQLLALCPEERIGRLARYTPCVYSVIGVRIFATSLQTAFRNPLRVLHCLQLIL